MQGYTPSGKKKKSNESNVEKSHKSACVSNVLGFLFPSLRGPPEV